MTDRRQDRELEPQVEAPAQVEQAPGFPAAAALQRRIQRRALQRRAHGARLDEASGGEGGRRVEDD